MSKLFLINLVLLTSLQAYAKGAKPIPAIPKVTITPVAASDQISLILDETIAGNRNITDSNCSQLSYTKDASALISEVNGQFFYLLLIAQPINGINFNPSECNQSIVGKATQIECVAKPVTATTMDGSDNLVFYIMWNNFQSNRLTSCPKNAKISY